jgi:hypothetical protein
MVLLSGSSAVAGVPVVYFITESTGGIQSFHPLLLPGYMFGFVVMSKFRLFTHRHVPESIFQKKRDTSDAFTDELHLKIQEYPASIRNFSLC